MNKARIGSSLDSFLEEEGIKEEVYKALPCPACGAVMQYESRPDVLTYENHQRTIQTLAWWCTKCEEGILSGEPLAAQERAFLELKAEVDEAKST